MATTILPLPGNRHVTSLAWDPTGSRIAATCSDGSLWVWHVPSQKLLFSRTFKGTQLLTVAWDPAGKKLALGSSAGLSVLQAWNGRLLLLVSQYLLERIEAGKSVFLIKYTIASELLGK